MHNAKKDIKQILIISGKGGTGKTVLTGSFAVLSHRAVFADCDVDASDLHLLLKPRLKEKHDFISGKKAIIDKTRCIGCGRCVKICRFDAVSPTYEIDRIACEGCGVCVFDCPAGAIDFVDNNCGQWYISDTASGPLVHAKLGIAEENSGKLVSTVKENAKKLAAEQAKELILIDGPPGIGCPVIASLAGVDLAVVVTEPTLSGISDMKRVIEVAGHFKIESKVIINKYDISRENTADIEKILDKMKVELLGKLPFSKDINDALVAGKPVIEYTDKPISKKIAGIWDKITDS